MKSKEETKNNREAADEVNEGSEIMNEAGEALPDASQEEKDPVAGLEAELTAANDKFLRLYSDFENYKKRISKERIEQAKMAGSDIFLALLPVIDDFERAIKSMEDAKEIKPVKEGVQLIYTKIKKVTSSKGLTEMESVGKPFDPEFHDAIANVPADEKMKGKVVEEIEKGYFLNDKVLRHAKVIVGN